MDDFHQQKEAFLKNPFLYDALRLVEAEQVSRQGPSLF
jgi:hypothetical protein